MLLSTFKRSLLEAFSSGSTGVSVKSPNMKSYFLPEKKENVLSYKLDTHLSCRYLIFWWKLVFDITKWSTEIHTSFGKNLGQEGQKWPCLEALMESDEQYLFFRLNFYTWKRRHLLITFEINNLGTWPERCWRDSIHLSMVLQLKVLFIPD